VRLHKARRTRKAQRIIREAYGIARHGRRVPIRFELLGDSVALAVVRVGPWNGPVSIKVARQLPDGRVSRMLKECRAGFPTVSEQIRYFETLYARYGAPQ
jgi:hypothetical protein